LNTLIYQFSEERMTDFDVASGLIFNQFTIGIEIIQFVIQNIMLTFIILMTDLCTAFPGA
jgi:hypothetical protein